MAPAEVASPRKSGLVSIVIDCSAAYLMSV